MGAILKPFVNLLGPGPRQIPMGPLEIDRSHPLARGLLGCWVPGPMGLVDLTRATKTLAPEAATQPSFDGVTPEGPGAKFAASGGTNGNGMFTTADSRYRTWTNASLYCRWLPLGNSGAYCTIISVFYAETPTDPFTALTLQGASSKLQDGIDLKWNLGGTFQGLTGLSGLPADGKMHSASASLTVGTTAPVSLYHDGVLNVSGTFNADVGPSYDATAPVAIGGNMNAVVTIGCIWNRVLSADEHRWMHHNPYCFLSPMESDMPVISEVAAAAGGSILVGGKLVNRSLLLGGRLVA